jgi:hypothetical protein
MKIGGKKGGRGNLDCGLPRDIVKGGGMSKHGFWIGRNRRVVREECAPNFFSGTNKGNSQLMSLLGNEEMLLMEEKSTVGSLKMGVARVSVIEGLPKLTMEEFTLVVIPLVHGTLRKVRWVWCDGGRTEEQFPKWWMKDVYLAST